jgi:transposase
MKKTTRFVGLDVHADSIAVAVAESDGSVRSLGVLASNYETLKKLLLKRVGRTDEVRVCYEAGPTGYGLYWELTKAGFHCDVVAPTLVPVRAGDRVKTDRRDAVKLARAYRSGDLTPVWVPDRKHEALRDLVRAREAAKKDQLRARHRLQKFLLRHDRRPPTKLTNWTQKHMTWIRTVTFDEPAQAATLLDYLSEVDHAHARIVRLEQAISDAVEAMPIEMRAVVEALQSLRGVAEVTAVTIAAEVGPLSRFARPKQLMGYSGAVSSEHSSGSSVRRGAITKAGNAHLRRVVIEAAWAYQHRPNLSTELRRRQQGLSEDIKAIAWKAQHRLHRRYQRLGAKGKPRQHIVTAIGRELLGFIWAIGVQCEKELATHTTKHRAAA